MTTGKLLVIAILICAAVAGAGLYYLQIYYFYERLPVQGQQINATTLNGDLTPLPISNFEGIDASSSPIRYRACFDVNLSLDEAKAQFLPYPDRSAPRTAPFWFECFDADAIGMQITAGDAVIFTGTSNIEYGIDRVIALTSQGRGYVWHEINDCGDKAYDGSPLGKNCPER